MERKIPLNELFPIIKNVLKVYEGVKFTVTGKSMSPSLCGGKDKVVVGYTNGRNLKKGDIILIEPVEGTFILRRIHRETDLGYVIKGDAKYREDGVIFPEHILGIVTKVYKRGREISPDALRPGLVSRLLSNIISRFSFY